MLKFGLYTTYIESIHHKKDATEALESIIRYLAFMLEYDEDYFRELCSGHFPLKRGKNY